MPLNFIGSFILSALVCSSHASAEPAPAVFLKAFYPLDEPRFYCVDIPGHKDRVNLKSALVVHTCKEGVWHKDELFAPTELPNGILKMSEYDLCVTASSTVDGAQLFLRSCDRSDIQTWDYQNYRLHLKGHSDKCLSIGSDAGRLTRGGKRRLSRHMARSLVLSTCSEVALQRQLWRFEAPQHRNSPVMPFQ